MKMKMTPKEAQDKNIRCQSKLSCEKTVITGEMPSCCRIYAKKGEFCGLIIARSGEFIQKES